MEYNVHSDGIRVSSVNSRRIDEIMFQIAVSSVKPSRDAVGKKPENVLQQMWTRNGRHFVPEQTSARLRCLTKFVTANTAYILNPLCINMDFGSSSNRESLELFDDTSLRAMAAVEKRRADREAQ